MLGNVRKAPEQLAAIARVEAWARARFALSDDDTMLVTELACAVPGCPPVETVIAFWTRAPGWPAGGATEQPRRYHLKVFKPVASVVEDDLPPGWMKRELAVPEDYECSCC